MLCHAAAPACVPPPTAEQPCTLAAHTLAACPPPGPVAGSRGELVPGLRTVQQRLEAVIDLSVRPGPGLDSRWAPRAPPAGTGVRGWSGTMAAATGVVARAALHESQRTPSTAAPLPCREREQALDRAKYGADVLNVGGHGRQCQRPNCCRC